MKTKQFTNRVTSRLPGVRGLGWLITLALAPLAQGQNCADYSATGGVNQWPQGRVPYTFVDGFPETVKQAVRAAMDDWMDSGGAIAFVEDPTLAINGSTRPYLKLSIGDSNGSLVGPHVPTTCSIVADMTAGTHSHATHELGHALGYPHEQARADRDNFVTVNFSNISRSERHNFELVPWECWPPGIVFTPYDYSSIMHYDWCLGSIPGCGSAVKGTDDTMTATDSFWQYRMGDWIGNAGATMSSGDHHRAEMVFGKAIWVDRNSGCTFADGRRTCDVLGFIGPYKTIPDAIGPVPDLWLPGINPKPTLMIRTGTYSRGTTGTLRIAKPMKLVAWEHAVRIQ